jgi:flagellar biosynthesis GTPase FlhF
MASNDKSNKAGKAGNQSEASTGSTAIVENTVTQASSEEDVNTADNPSTDLKFDLPVEIGDENPVDEQREHGATTSSTNQSAAASETDGRSETTTSEQPTELQQLVDTELKEVEAEIEALKGQLKEKQKRIRELLKKPNSSGPTKKEQAENWLVSHSDTTLLDFINYAVGELDISPVYANTVFKQLQKPKIK